MEKLELKSPKSNVVHEIFIVDNIRGYNHEIEKYFDDPGMLERFEDAMKQLLQVNQITVRKGEWIFFEEEEFSVEDVTYAVYPGRTVVSIILK